jgi:SAM-dependent methyltransferase
MSRQRWEEKYRRGEHVGNSPLAFIAELAARIEPGKALDLAAGSGRHSRLLAEHGWSVTAVDWSGEALGMLPPGVTRIEADLEGCEYRIEPGAWDLIVDTCYWQPGIVSAIKEGVRGGGRVAFAIPMDGSMNPAYTVSPGQLRRIFADWVVEYDREERLAELVARKPRSWKV